MAYARFEVTVTPKMETWNNKQYTVTIYARDGAQAVKQARAQYKANEQDFGQLPATYKVKKEEQSKHVSDGYNVEFFGAKPAELSRDY